MNYRLVFSNPNLRVELPADDVTRLLELIADPVLRWKPINIGTSGDLLIPAHVAFIEKL